MSCPGCGATAAQSLREYRRRSDHPLFEGRRVVSCRACILAYCDPQPDGKLVENYYLSGAYDEGERGPLSASPWELFRLRGTAQYEYLSSCSAVPVRSWLDLGAGYGMLLDEARKRGCRRTAAVEPTPLRYDVLREKGHLVFRDLTSVEGRWDVISFSHVLEHLTDPVNFLDGVRTRLADAGSVLCEVPNEIPRHAKFDEPHLLFFNRRSLSHLFERSGFDVVCLESAGRKARRSWLSAGSYLRAAGQKGLLPDGLVKWDPFFTNRGFRRMYLRCVVRTASSGVAE